MPDYATHFVHTARRTLFNTQFIKLVQWLLTYSSVIIQQIGVTNTRLRISKGRWKSTITYSAKIFEQDIGHSINGQHSEKSAQWAKGSFVTLSVKNRIMATAPHTQPPIFISSTHCLLSTGQEGVLFYLMAVLYIDHCINVPATGFGKGHFTRESHVKGYCHINLFCTTRRGSK